MTHHTPPVDPAAVEETAFARWLRRYVGEQDPSHMRFSVSELECAFNSGATPTAADTQGEAVERAREIAIKHALPGRYDGVSSHAARNGSVDSAPYMLAIIEALASLPPQAGREKQGNGDYAAAYMEGYQHAVAGLPALPIAPAALSAPPAQDGPSREEIARVLADNLYAFATDDDGDCGEWEDMSQGAREIYLITADAVRALLQPTQQEDSRGE